MILSQIGQLMQTTACMHKIKSAGPISEYVTRVRVHMDVFKNNQRITSSFICLEMTHTSKAK